MKRRWGREAGRGKESDSARASHGQKKASGYRMHTRRTKGRFSVHCGLLSPGEEESAQNHPHTHTQNKSIWPESWLPG